jgi:AcrR family transcriptional regulator
VQKKIGKAGTSARAPADRLPLTREGIASAALGIVDGEGLEGLSMRRLGSELGVEAMALYHHFRNKGEVLDAVMERMLDEIEWPERGTATPMARLKKLLGSYRRLAVRHPRAFILLVNRRFNTDRSFEFYERVLEAMADLGLDAALSARYFRMFGYYMNGAGLAEVASRAAAPDATPVRLENFHGSARFRHIAAVAPHLRVSKLDAIYDFGLQLILREMQKSAKEAVPKRKRGGE